MDTDILKSCQLCPRKCGTNRILSLGYCGGGSSLKLARASLHFWEEPCISGENGSGTVFFSGCQLKCCFCQNYHISAENYGLEISTERLSEIFLELQEHGANNINLVSATQYIPFVINALDKVKHKLSIPIVFNSGGYESVETIKMLEDYIDIYIPDLKYKDIKLSQKYSFAGDYFEVATNAILEMHRQTKKLVWNNDLLQKGLIIRHLVIPNCRHDSMQILEWIAENLPKDTFLISLMSQFTPTKNCSNFPELKRRITTMEYNSVVDKALDLGLKGFMQERSSAKEEYTPLFDLTGIKNN